MIDTHRLTIVPFDGAVASDDFSVTDLDFSNCNIPDNIHALQWNNPLWPDKNKSHLIGLQYGQGQGWIEFTSPEPNLEINELPQWALNAYELAKQNRYNT